jgi:hypothetical protein
MDEDRFNLALRVFLKEVGVTSQREIEKLVRDCAPGKDELRLRMVLTSPDEPALNHVVERTIHLG